MTKSRSVATPGGPCVLRPETAEDQPFLRRLFDESRGEDLRAAGLAPAQIEPLLAMQFRSQTATYAHLFSEARFWIVERAGEPAARLIEDDRVDAVHVVDIAVGAAHRRGGLATALLRQTQALAIASGRGVTADVHVGNGPSQALFARLGFTGTHSPGDAQIQMTWRAER